MLLRAFAKINLDLRILGKRADGFHEVHTVLQTIDWFDELEITPSREFTFHASHGPQDESNLVVRAVRAFEAGSGIDVKVRIELKKSIPSGAGLGGGSSDAAVAFLGLQRLYGVTLAPDCLRLLGADVPFFIYGGRCVGRGRGDQVELLPDDPEGSGCDLVLVEPGVTVSTAEAYSWLTLPDKSNTIEGFRAQFVPDREYVQAKNDFEGPVFARYPELIEIRDSLLRQGAFRSALSGSGSVVFGQFRDRVGAERAAAGLGGQYSVRLAKSLSRANYLRSVFG